MRKGVIAARLHGAAIRMLRHLHRADQQMQLSPARASVLSVLVFGGARTPGQLSAIERVAAPTMTKLLNGLERDGYVRKRPSTSDARSVVVHATGRARHTLREGRRRRLLLMKSMLGELTDTEWLVLGQAASIIERSLRNRDRTQKLEAD